MITIIIHMTKVMLTNGGMMCNKAPVVFEQVQAIHAYLRQHCSNHQHCRSLGQQDQHTLMHLMQSQAYLCNGTLVMMYLADAAHHWRGTRQ